MDDVFQAADTGVVDFGEVVGDIVVEISLYVSVFGFVWIAACRAVIPVPSVGADDGLPVWQFSAVDDRRSGRLDEADQVQ